MTVYVDDMRAQFRGMIMCHMIAHTADELHAMADRIGVARRWFQGDHYDIALSKRALAVRYGAEQITWRQCGLMAAVVRMGFPMPVSPDMAEAAWLAARQLRPILANFYDLNDVRPIDEIA